MVYTARNGIKSPKATENRNDVDNGKRFDYVDHI